MATMVSIKTPWARLKDELHANHLHTLNSRVHSYPNWGMNSDLKFAFRSNRCDLEIQRARRWARSVLSSRTLILTACSVHRRSPDLLEKSDWTPPQAFALLVDEFFIDGLLCQQHSVLGPSTGWANLRKYLSISANMWYSVRCRND